jgi:ribonuclease HII
MRIAGVDEAGRGPLAGPVVAAAAILPWRCRLPGLRDSKLLSEEERERLFGLIEKRALSVGVGIADARMVDRMNVLEANRLAMREAVEQLDPQPELLLVDGRELLACGIAQRAIVGGDRLCASIAAASVVAKVVRDRMMRDIDALYPGYGFRTHKGYATKEHRARLLELGPCPEHRLSFAPVQALLQARLPLGGSSGETGDAAAARRGVCRAPERHLSHYRCCTAMRETR